MSRASVVCRAALGATLLASGAAAQGAPSVTLEGCQSLSEAAFRKHLSLELSTLGLERALPALELHCDRGFVTIAVQLANAKRYPVAARVDLGDTARGARERLAALAASELVARAVRATEAEAEPHAAESKPESAPAARVDLTPPKPARPARFELSASGTAVALGAPRATLWGAALGSRIGLGSRWSLLLDTRFERGDDALSLAKVRWSSLSGLLGVASRLRAGPLELSAGLGARVGWLSLSATAAPPYQGQSMTAPWAGVAVPLRASFALGGSVKPFVGAEAGYVTLPVRGNVGDGERLVEHSGAWLSASLGAAIEL